MAVRSTTAGAGRMIFAVRSAAMTPATIGAPRSVLQGDCAAASIMKGRSALLGGCKPSVVASYCRIVWKFSAGLEPERVKGTA